jgi:short-subunit dehydrogenase
MISIKNEWALITGSSSGIGEDIAHQLAQKGCNVILTARRKERLDITKKILIEKYNIKVEVICSDLSSIEGVKSLINDTEKLNLPISILINNAGGAVDGDFIEQTLEQKLSVIELNINALTHITHHFLPIMKERNKGWILQVSSTISFQAVPGFSVYAATKAYVLFLSEGLSYELKDSNVSNSVLCPGPTKTEFFDSAGIDTIPPILRAMMLKPSVVAKIAIKGMLKEKTIIIPGILNKIVAFLPRLSPRSLSSAVSSIIFK